jgi:hypothetical protein
MMKANVQEISSEIGELLDRLTILQLKEVKVHEKKKHRYHEKSKK